MAHYAFIDSNNVVVKIITGVDETVTQDDNGTLVGGSSEAWEQFYENQPWHSGLTCKRTSYSGKIRKQFAAVGGTYLVDADVFVHPQPYPSWTLDKSNDWQAPTRKPSTGGPHKWSEEDLEWVAI
jgi:hypothetical protein